jgi:hypothetical protein
MPSALRSPKTLSQWLELDYFRRRRLLRNPWRVLTWGTLALSCLAVGWTFLPGKQTIYQAGPLSTAHAIFSNDCARCHTESFPGLQRLLHSDSSVRSTPDHACLQCHDGPLHHECAAQPSCASCHREHRGQAALARVGDSQCTTCHADLRCDKGGEPQYDRHITGFAEDQHPEFRLWLQGETRDPGKLRFNHKVHLQGLIDIDREQLRLRREDLRKAGVTWQEDDLPRRKVQLECASCHQVDAAGRYMLTVRFERHCKDCHPLSIQLVGDWKGPAQELARAFDQRPVPHPETGEKADIVRARLRDRLTRFIQKPENKPLLSAGEPAEPARQLHLPGWSQVEPVSKQQFAWVNQQLGKMEHILFDGGGGCRHCHHETTAPENRPGGLPVYELPGLNGGDSPWFKHSVFHHDSHKMLKCTECHSAPESTTAADVLVPRARTCQECHNSRADSRARVDCVECHVYHNPEQKRSFRGDLTIEQVLRK